jgi:hypothetical protein
LERFLFLFLSFSEDITFTKWFSTSKTRPLHHGKGIQLNKTLNIEIHFGVFINWGEQEAENQIISKNQLSMRLRAKGYTGVVYDFKYPELARHYSAYAS